MEPSTQPTSPAIPIAIICGFAMIAIAIFFTNQSEPAPQEQTATEEDAGVTEQAPRSVTDADYIRGNPNAPILMIEYSDYDCPFCKQYHATLNQIMDEYGISGKVAWAYRQFPLAELHPNSPKISEAALCVGKLGGNEAFWKFTDAVYGSRDIDEATNIIKLPDLAEAAGVTKDTYTSCINGSEMEEKVMADIKDGYNAGARGTPYTILIVGDQQAVISGAQPYDVVKGIVQNLIDQLNGAFDPTATEVSEVKKNEQGVPVLE
jgi:protein-disulfide isomerase